MYSFTLYVHDDRYSAPNMLFLDAENTERAKELANAELSKSEHTLAVDVLQGETVCYRATRRGASEPSAR